MSDRAQLVHAFESAALSGHASAAAYYDAALARLDVAERVAKRWRAR